MTQTMSFAYRLPHAPANKASRRMARAIRTVPIVAALTLIVVPEQSGTIAAFEPAVAPTQLTSGSEQAVPLVDTTQFAFDVAQPFHAAYADGTSPGRAETCLTEAIYYEGALEPLAGQRAIAQVVLNRLRHPEYPKTVCGVVFQGSHLSTGCQFTFTCDGSRGRAPDPVLWRRANLVAKAALGGMVAKEVGLATHYHADYVNPYWSSSLDRAGQIGRHIFYRWRGSAGQPEAFTDSYQGREPEIAEWTARAAAPAAAAATATAVSGQAVAAGEPAATASEAPVDNAPAAPAVPFKARPLMLVTGEGDPQ